MPNRELDRFGEILIRQVRDKVISDWDRVLSGDQKGETANEVRTILALSGGDAASVVSKVIPKLVDSALHQLLQTVEEERAIRVSIGDDKSTAVSLREASDGLAGELYGRRGWIARFSQQRHGETV